MDLFDNALLVIAVNKALDRLGLLYSMSDVASVISELRDHGVTLPVRCKDCEHRGDAPYCPMCFEEMVEWDNDGYTEVDYIQHDYTVDNGYCDRGERRVGE